MTKFERQQLRRSTAGGAVEAVGAGGQSRRELLARERQAALGLRTINAKKIPSTPSVVWMRLS